MISKVVCTCVALALALGSSVLALGSPLDIALPYNYFVLHNFSASTDITGRIAAGGTIKSSNVFGSDIGQSTDPYSLSSYPITVYAAGGMSDRNAATVQHGSEYLGTGSGAFNQNGGGSILASCGANCIDFQTAATSLTAFSNQLATLNQNGTITVDTQLNPSFTALNGTSSTLNIFNITAADFQTKTFDVRAPGSATTLINVTGNVTGTGGALYINGNQASGTQAAGSKILFNFANATAVNINQQFSASILAPNAVFSSSSQIDGSIIVSSVISSGGVRDALFTGASNLPSSSVATPEPANFLTLGGGMALILFARQLKHLKK